ncbi:MAG: cob(I)yrinic acid a,c-diamide adenosyltransferase [Bacteroides sp.]|nr:cob(I)yrinic acid a,c-diamide adenosyltransferase [Bacteroides sp.]
MAKSNIYTRTGDEGMTSLVGGARIAKDDVRLEAYGTVDELNAQIGLLRVFTGAIADDPSSMLDFVQNRLFNIGAYLATPGAESCRGLSAADIECLEHSMDEMDEALPALRSFVLPGGTRAAAEAHICRTVCRRAERRVLTLGRTESVVPEVVKFLNRLSDWLFVYSRMLTVRAGVPEVMWKAPSE